VEDACGEREDDGGEEEDELGAEQDLLEVVEESPQRRAGDLAEEGEVGLLAERGGGHVVGRAAEVAGGQLLGAGLEEPRGSGGGGGGVHAGAPAPPLLLPPDGGSAPVRQREAEGAGVCVRRSSRHVGVAWLWPGWSQACWGCADGGPPSSVSQRGPSSST
jgi:hypothetical protein